MLLILGESYTRTQIHEEVGVERVSYLPQHDGKIVCGCFSTVDNLEAPTVILVGGGDESGKIVKKTKLLEKWPES